MKKKKLFFIVGFVFSAFAASFFIPLKDGSYWWQAFSEPQVVVTDVSDDRLPAGTNQGEPLDSSGDDPTIPADEPVEPEPVYSGNDKTPDYTPTPAPKPAPPPQTGTCIHKVFNGGINGVTISGVVLSDSYINQFLAAANNNKRKAITGLVAAGYCPRYQSFSNRRNLSSKQLIPVVHGKNTDANVDERKRAWKNNIPDDYQCPRGKDTFENATFKRSNGTKYEIGYKGICEKIFRACRLGEADKYCRMSERDGNDRDDHKPGGGNNNGGDSGSQKEVGEGSNQGSGHAADGGGAQGDGPPGGVSQ